MQCRSCLDVIGSHASVRKFLPEPLDQGDLERILEAARRAPSSWNLQPIVVTAVTDPELKRRLSEAVGGQEHVAQAPVFLVFSVDYRKLIEASRSVGVEPAEPGLGHFIVGVLDAGIASGWAALAAETLGYGIVFVALYADPCRVAEILNLPRYVVPVVGLCIGKPAERPEPRPRHPMEVFAAVNRYPSAPDAVENVAGIYRGRGVKLFRYVLAPGGYYEEAGGAVLRCLKQRGYRVPGSSSKHY